MKSLLKSLLLFFSIAACSEETTVEYKDKPTFHLRLFMQQSSVNNNGIKSQISFVDGFIIAEPGDLITSLSFDDSVCFTHFNYISPFYITFWGDNRYYESSYIPFKSKTVQFSAITSRGSASGQVTMPDSVKNLQVDKPTELKKGESLTLTFSGNADFYSVYIGYLKEGKKHSWLFDTVGFDTLVTGTQVTIPASYFPEKGVIDRINVTPVGGNYPGPGGRGNIHGPDPVSGFLFYIGDVAGIKTDISVQGGLLQKVSPEIPDDIPVLRLKRQLLKKLN